jgi:hypothetical protein
MTTGEIVTSETAMGETAMGETATGGGTANGSRIGKRARINGNSPPPPATGSSIEGGCPLVLDLRGHSLQRSDLSACRIAPPSAVDVVVSD